MNISGIPTLCQGMARGECNSFDQHRTPERELLARKNFGKFP